MMYAGLHFPNGREDWGRIMALPSPLLLMLASEARYHYDDARNAGQGRHLAGRSPGSASARPRSAGRSSPGMPTRS
jgi:hypothetical protein